MQTEFESTAKVVDLIQQYINCYSLKSIDKEYFKVFKPIINDESLNDRIKNEFENYANVRPMIFRNLNSKQTTVIDFEQDIKDNFIEYSKDINLEIVHVKNHHFSILSKLSFICLAGKAIESELFRSTFNMNYKFIRRIINKILNRVG